MGKGGGRDTVTYGFTLGINEPATYSFPEGEAETIEKQKEGTPQVCCAIELWGGVPKP